MLAFCPGNQDMCREALLDVFIRIPDLSETKDVIETHANLDSAIIKSKTAFTGNPTDGVGSR